MLETIQVKANGWVEDASILSGQRVKKSDKIGGTVLAVSKQNVIFWKVIIPSCKINECGLLRVAKDGWGDQAYKTYTLCASGTVRVLAWKNPSYNVLPYSVTILPTMCLTELNVDDKIDLEIDILN